MGRRDLDRACDHSLKANQSDRSHAVAKESLEAAASRSCGCSCREVAAKATHAGMSAPSGSPAFTFSIVSATRFAIDKVHSAVRDLSQGPRCGGSQNPNARVQINGGGGGSRTIARGVENTLVVDASQTSRVVGHQRRPTDDRRVPLDPVGRGKTVAKKTLGTRRRVSRLRPFFSPRGWRPV